MPESTLTCIGGVYRFLDEETGETIEVPVSVDLSTAIQALDEGLARREKLQKRHERSLSALLSTQRDGEYDTVDPRSVVSKHEGPRLKFTLLIGFGDRWDGPLPRASRCPCCQGKSLPTHAYCLGCDRSGLDDLLKTLAPGAPLTSPPEPRSTSLVVKKKNPKKTGKSKETRRKKTARAR